jgi:hypothetical protein
MAAAISNEETDLIGLGRPACLDPLLSTKILDRNLANYVSPNPPVPGVTLWKILVPVKLIGAGFKTMWSVGRLSKSTENNLRLLTSYLTPRHTWQLHRMSCYQPPDLACTALGSLRVILPLDAILVSLAVLLSLLTAGIVARLVA